MPSQDFWRQNVTVYLIHLDRPLHHANHYLGSAEDLEERLHEHRTGNGSHLMAAVEKAGITWAVVRTWENVPRWFEAQLHHRHDNPGLCPVCHRLSIDK